MHIYIYLYLFTGKLQLGKDRTFSAACALREHNEVSKNISDSAAAANLPRFPTNVSSQVGTVGEQQKLNIITLVTSRVSVEIIGYKAAEGCLSCRVFIFVYLGFKNRTNYYW